MVICSALLLVGLPHGTLDINLLTRYLTQRKKAATVLVFIYLSLAVAMFVAWATVPIIALVMFLIISVVHFAEDWAEGDNSFFAIGTATALLTLPTLLHLDLMRVLFVDLTGRAAAAQIAAVMLLLAPIALSAALAGLISEYRARRLDTVVTSVTTLSAMLFLPPLLGFALYFCIFHSPRHLVGGLREFQAEAPQLVKRAVVPLTLAAFGIAALVYGALQRGTLGAHAVSAAFVTLSILTVPHMLVPKIFARLTGLR